jgi:hypothetical protein
MLFFVVKYDHYELILSPYTFSRCNANIYCFKCMRYYRRWESKESHVCKTVQSCQSCYSSYNGCKEEEGFFQECTACSVHFRNKECFVRHLTKKVFKTSWGNFETPCAHMFFCDTCYKKVPRKTPITRKKQKNINATKHIAHTVKQLKKKSSMLYENM